MDLRPFQDQAGRLAEAVRRLPKGTRWAIDCDTDADGIASAAVAAWALLRLGHRFHIHPSRDKTREAYDAFLARDADAYLVLDKGTSHLEDLAAFGRETGRPVAVIDHHNLPGDGTVPDGVHLLNPRACGLDGSRDACSSTSTVAWALALHGDAALAQAANGLVGAIGDWQHMGGWQGWNQHLVESALAAGHLERRRMPVLIGVDLADAVARHRKVQLPGLHGDPDAVADLLQRLGVGREGEVAALDADTRTRLVSGLVLHGLAAGVAPDELAGLADHVLVHPRLGIELRAAFRIVDACGREGRPTIGVACLLGDLDARRESESLFATYHRTLFDALERLRTDGAKPYRAFQHFPIASPAYTGMVAGLGITHFAPDKALPLCVTAPRPDGDVQVSTRGDHPHVEAGMDLGAACKEAGAAVGREGGGHPVAAGVVVGADDLERFLAALDDALRGQGFLVKRAPQTL